MWTPSLDGRNPTRYLAIVEAVADGIAAGALRPGERLPTHRELAWQLRVNVSTVTQAYREAARRHLVSGEVGRGTYVLSGSREAALFALKEPGSARDGGGVVGMIDLSTNVPAVDPNNKDLEETLASMAREGALGGAALGYHQPMLLQRARLAGVSWLARRGLHLRPADVVPCAGGQASLVAVLLALCAPGDGVLVEELTFPGMKAAARQLRLPLHGVEMDEEGVLPDALDRAARATGVKVVVIVPTLQNPTGAVMGETRRQHVAEIARRHGLWMVEDDVYGALTDVPPLAALLPGRSIMVTSLSKTVAAGLRFGLIAGDCAPVRTLAAEAHATAWPLAPLMTEVACRWIEDGTAVRRVGWQRGEVAIRCQQARKSLAGLGFRFEVPSPHVWMPLASAQADEAAAACRAAGVEVVASGLFAVTREAPGGVRVSLTAGRDQTELAHALNRLQAVEIVGTPSLSLKD